MSDENKLGKYNNNSTTALIATSNNKIYSKLPPREILSTKAKKERKQKKNERQFSGMGSFFLFWVQKGPFTDNV